MSFAAFDREMHADINIVMVPFDPRPTKIKGFAQFLFDPQNSEHRHG
jgi:hypothetical protein